MHLTALDSTGIFSLTLWRSEAGYTVGVQKYAGDPVRYETRKTASGAIEAVLTECSLPKLPY